jgi:hypothetical protein
VSGGVYDMESLDSLPSSEILANKKLIMTTDNHGTFCVSLLRSDTLTIAHLGYVKADIVLSELIISLDSLQLNVLMKEQIYEIPEVSVLPYRTYGEFIRAVTNQNMDQRLINANKNIRNMETQINRGYFPDNDGQMSYQYYLNYKTSASNSIVLFSSPPNKGIIPAIKKLLNR